MTQGLQGLDPLAGKLFCFPAGDLCSGSPFLLSLLSTGWGAVLIKQLNKSQGSFWSLLVPSVPGLIGKQPSWTFGNLFCYFFRWESVPMVEGEGSLVPGSPGRDAGRNWGLGTVTSPCLMRAGAVALRSLVSAGLCQTPSSAHNVRHCIFMEQGWWVKWKLWICMQIDANLHSTGCSVGLVGIFHMETAILSL